MYGSILCFQRFLCVLISGIRAAKIDMGTPFQTLEPKKHKGFRFFFFIASCDGTILDV